HALIDADRERHGDDHVEHPLGLVASGPMVAMIDVDRALFARGYSHHATIVIRIEDANRTIRLDTGAREPTLRNVDEPPMLETTTRALTAIAFGGLLPTEAQQLGMAKILDS